MYKDEEKKSALRALAVGIGKFSPTDVTQNLVGKGTKKADSHLANVEMPKADKPTAAGEEVSDLEKKPEEKVLSSEDKSQNSPLISQNMEMKKLSVVLSQAVRHAMSPGGQYTPYNVGVSTRPQPPAPVMPPPVGAAPQQPQQPQQPQNPAAYQGALGGPGAISPSSNPINNYGPISRSGDINGNAAFGIKNSPDSSKSASSPAWQRSEGQNSEGGLNAKGRASYNKATGGNLKAPVTESNPSGERAKRQNSFCSRMCGMKSKETGAKTKADPDSRINKSLRKWNCKCGSAYEFGLMLSGKSAASICSILDNKSTCEEGKKVEDVKPTFQETDNKADLNPNDATNKKQEEKAAGIPKSIGGQRWQFGEAGINPQLGYKYMLGVIPTPDVALRVGTPSAGVGIGMHPWPYIFSDKGQPSGRMGNRPRSLYKYLGDNMRSPEDAFFVELGNIEDNAPAGRYEKLLRDRGVGRSSEEIRLLSKILSESADVKRNSMARRLPAAVQSVLKNYRPENPKSLFMNKQSSVALDIYAKYAARGDQGTKQEKKYLEKHFPTSHTTEGHPAIFSQGRLRRLTPDSTPGERSGVRMYAQRVKRLKERNNDEQG